MALSGLIDRLGAIKNVKGTRDGALSVAPWYQVLVTEGRVFGIHAGSVTTPLAGHTGADADQPEAAIRIPDGTVGMPIFCAMSATLSQLSHHSPTRTSNRRNETSPPLR